MVPAVHSLQLRSRSAQHRSWTQREQEEAQERGARISELVEENEENVDRATGKDEERGERR